MDTTVLAFLAAPFVASLILTGIHAYLGVHVVERGVIFVDLSLAQIAALGATIAILLPINGGDPHSAFSYWVSLAFTFLGAFIFSTIRSRRAQERECQARPVRRIAVRVAAGPRHQQCDGGAKRGNLRQ